ncbi:PucR family transcriptional regulator [Alkalihalobacillus sp. 1P02AB]|uniref:PucR family transcriptional regulator n=1 Tax=Alkalihalobacillus sp. 1P02AB TaxID=3132260 RepID=UPI0039A739A8
MKLKKILELSTFKQSKVVAGGDGLKRHVQSVNLMDAPDIIHYLNKDQLLLTTAYSLQNEEELYKLVKQMAEKGCAGLGLKTKRYIEKIPDKILELANDFDFPIIELSLDYSLGEMLNEALGYILKEQTSDLHYALTIHREFTDIILSGGGFNAIVERLSQLLEVPVVLLNDRLDIMTASTTADKESFFDVYWYVHELIHDKEYLNYQQLTLPHDKEEHVYENFILYPIIASSQQKGYLIILGGSPSQSSPFILAVEQSANVISFEFMKLYAIEQQERRIKHEFFTDLVDGAITTKEELLNRGKAFGLERFHQYVCITCKMDSDSTMQTTAFPLKEEKKLRLKRERTYELLETLLLNHYSECVLFTKGDLFTFIVGFDFYSETIEAQLIDTLNNIQSDLQQMLDITLSFGISNNNENLLEIPGTFQEAVEALRSGFRENQQSFIKMYRTKELTEILKTIPIQKLKDYYLTSLKELADPDDKEKEDLVLTLMTFLSNHCQISDTAKSMFVHRNTVIYRIKKCEEILGTNLKNPDETLKLRLALFVKPLIERYI